MLQRVIHDKPHWDELSIPDRIKLIQEVWEAGCSGSQIAARVTARIRGKILSRSVISGLYHRNVELRIGYPLGGGRTKTYLGGRSRRGAGKRPKPKSKISAKTGLETNIPPQKYEPVRVSEKAKEYDLASRRISLFDLGSRDCRWPVNNTAPGEETLFCGHHTELGSPYCEHHHNRAWTPRIRNRRKKRKVLDERSRQEPA